MPRPGSCGGGSITVAGAVTRAVCGPSARTSTWTGRQAWLPIVSPPPLPDMEAMGHPLDRAIWASLTSRQAPLGVAHAGARRYLPEFALFAALDDASPESLAALSGLIVAHGPVAIVEAEAPPDVPSTRIAQRGELVQMI